MADETKIIVEQLIYASKIVTDDQIFYNKEILSELSDFNYSLEAFGYEGYNPYPPQKYWIVSEKSRSVLINELNQNEFDFIPVILTDEKKN
ncbi:MAG: hypothetical protein LBU81_01340 [Methanosarcinales archaeon]|nr:hypothetical protein [Methanosarcinales archaeon]